MHSIQNRRKTTGAEGWGNEAIFLNYLSLAKGGRRQFDNWKTDYLIIIFIYTIPYHTLPYYTLTDIYLWPPPLGINNSKFGILAVILWVYHFLIIKKRNEEENVRQFFVVQTFCIAITYFLWRLCVIHNILRLWTCCGCIWQVTREVVWRISDLRISWWWWWYDLSWK